VENHLIREKDAELQQKDANIDRLQARIDQLLQKSDQILDDNKKTHEDLKENKLAHEFTHHILERTERRVDALVDVVVPPEKQIKLHETFILFKLNSGEHLKQFKAVCCQQLSIKSSLKRLVNEFPRAEQVFEAAQIQTRKMCYIA
jgi:hypothetical protein